MKRYLGHSPKTVALIGMGPSIGDFLSETLTQEFTGREFADEIWAINMSSNAFRHDVVFWMDDLKSQKEFRPKLIEALAERGKPVITSKAYPDLVPSSYDYPLDDIIKLSVPLFGKPYLNNGVAMAVAYALHLGVKVLKIYGCDFNYPNRDFAEKGRACVETWIAIAVQRGMGIQLCPNTSIHDMVADHGVYGYSEQPEMAIPMPDGTMRVGKYVKAGPDLNKWAYTNPAAPEPGGPPLYHPETQVDLDKGEIRYTPEDSSGVKPHAANRPEPQENAAGTGHPGSAVAGGGAADGQRPAADAAPATRRSGNGLWPGREREPRRDEGGDSARPVGG